MSSAPEPKRSRRKSLPLIWVVPAIALCIGLWMAYDAVKNLGPKISIDFSDGSGLEAGKTTLEYKGIAAGTVEDVEYRPDLAGVRVSLRLHRQAASLAKEGAKFWVVHPQIGFSGVRGLETLVTGVRMNVQPGNGPLTQHFVGLDSPPPPDVTNEGRAFILRSEKLGSLTTGAPVFYREFKVGEVEASRFSDDATSVLIRIHIDGPYTDLVRSNTKFWNAGGFSFKVSLLGASLKDTSLESLITGGVGLATPEGPLAPAAASGTEFDLAPEAQKEWLKWSPHITVKAPENLVPKAPSSGIIPALIK